MDWLMDWFLDWLVDMRIQIQGFWWGSFNTFCVGSFTFYDKFGRKQGDNKQTLDGDLMMVMMMMI